MRVLSLFDGMACGMLAMMESGINVDRYVAYEIDKYAIKSAKHNFPMIEEMGDVFSADFTQYFGFDWLIGGSPCTFWSIAQSSDRRETTASGLGWDLFSQYVRALNEVKPKYFIYENNKSMSLAIRDSIRGTFGFEEICINSALVSAQTRKRYYWVGKRNLDGTYSKVDINQPIDRGILLKDVLDCACMKDLSDREMEYMVRETTHGRNHFDFGYIQNATKDKGACVTANISKGVPYNVCCVPVSLVDRDKAHVLKHQAGNARDYFKKHHTQVAFTPVRVGTYPNSSRNQEHDSKQYRIYDIKAKSTCLCGQGGGMGAKTGLYAMPLHITQENSCADDNNVAQLSQMQQATEELLCVCNREPLVVSEATKTGSATIYQGECVDVTHPKSKTRRGRQMSDKSNCLTTDQDYCQYMGVLVYATPIEWDSFGNPIKAISGTDDQIYNVYKVLNNEIFINGQPYPIKLIDGYYIIRKLTVSECKRLQTVPEWYEFPVSNTQAYKQLGNGWTVSVISHLINACVKN